MIFILVPVHNRLVHVKPFVEDLARQRGAPEFRLVVIDAGSTDGTREFLRSFATGQREQPLDLDIVEGHGDWWWSRSIQMGIDRVLPHLSTTDKVMIINDDVSLDPTYLQRIAELSDDHPDALITSCLVATDDATGVPFHFGVSIDQERLRFVDVVPAATDGRDMLLHSDVASGRGTLFPASAIRGGVRPRVRQLPHYLADYDMGLQARALGYTIIGRSDIYVTTDEVQGNARRFKNQFQYRTRQESPGRLLTWWNFWTSPTLGMGRMTVLGRACRHMVRRGA